ncbi:MAG TPA: glycosyltransferase [Bryobacteraceae bacterium]|jgi:MGT family glycosyltransferase
MARFLVTCWPFVGHLYPQISVARALRERGHEVGFYTHESARRVVESEGFQLFPFVHVDEARYERIHALEAQVPATQPKYQTISVAMTAYRDMLTDSIPEQIADLQPILGDWRPDALITDPAFWGPIVVLWEMTGIPVALLTQMIGSMIPGPDAPPWGPGLPSPRTFGTRMLARAAQVGVDVVAHNMRRHVNRIRARYALGPMGCSVNAYTGRLPLYLIPSVPELDYNRHDQPSNVHYVGPCIWTKPAGAAASDWLNELPVDRPWVHATEGTAQYQEPFLLRAAARGLSGLPMEVVLTTGQNRDPESLGLHSMAPNVHATRWLSHEDFLPRCAALLTTGGAATVLASLKAGVPLLVVPTFWDKSDNAQRVVEAGVGLRLAPRHCTPDRVRAAVQRLLNEPHFRANARRMAELFAKAQGPPRAAELLEGLVRQAAGSATAA